MLVVEPLPVHAAPSLVQQNKTYCLSDWPPAPCTSAILSVSFTSSVASGDVVLVAVYSGGGEDITVSSVSDSLGSSFTQAVMSSSLIGGFAYAYIYYATLSSSGSDQITVTRSSSSTEYATVFHVFIYELSGVTTTGYTTGTGAGDYGAPVFTTPTAFQSGAFLLAIIGNNILGTNFTPGSGFTPSRDDIGVANVQYSTSGVSSPTTFPATFDRGNRWVEAGIALNAMPEISLNPTCGPPGTRVVVTGSGFTRHANSFCEIHSNPAGLVGTTRGTDFDCNILNDGSVSGPEGPAFFVVAAGASGSYSVTVYYAPPGETPQESAPVGFSTQCGGPMSGPVGGLMEPVNKLAVFAPYLALFGMVAVVAVVVAAPWKKKTDTVSR
jgi:hypothetical protein